MRIRRPGLGDRNGKAGKRHVKNLKEFSTPIAPGGSQGLPPPAHPEGGPGRGPGRRVRPSAAWRTIWCPPRWMTVRPACASITRPSHCRETRASAQTPEQRYPCRFTGNPPLLGGGSFRVHRPLDPSPILRWAFQRHVSNTPVSETPSKVGSALWRPQAVCPANFSCLAGESPALAIPEAR